ncbi:myo-inosose-2 dehydratase [Rossellomorea aquimaris]|uniref:Myo-inosose-2 dehydratase n=2 Tax=Rossellomorea aquimaris TaxID=189382 RepID=A0A5D4TNE2_9BACI|nr:myo-inosose-2 dehydratase [Rossellomorea aquimaris]TYS83068.1 myo-inosose-2 dehydratase [Rossellomorea aquimaris]
MDTMMEPIKLGVSAINWANEDVLSLGDHYSGDTILSEMASLGYTGTEMSRKFPQEVPQLKSFLSDKRMELASQWKGVLFSDHTRHSEELKSFTDHVFFLKEMGCQTVVTCDIGGSTIGDPRREPGENTVLTWSDQEWESMMTGLEKAGQICRKHGLYLVYHHHMGTNVETRDQIDRLMAGTDPELVHLLFDSGHAYYAGADPLSLLKAYKGRVKHVHLKDIRKQVLDKVRKDGMDFKTSVLENVFTVPGDGIISFKPILEEFHGMGYNGWMIVEAEQNPDEKNPYAHAKTAKQYLDCIWNEILAK